jgi:hypothetical protein
MSAMRTISAPADRHSRYSGAPKLRLLARGEQRRLVAFAPARAARSRVGVAAPAQREMPPVDAPVLVAGRDASRRVAMTEEFGRTMAAGTKFVHASALWEVLVQAGSSRMVILSGDLDEVSTESLMRMLGHRYPALPVVALDAPQAALAHA